MAGLKTFLYILIDNRDGNMPRTYYVNHNNVSTTKLITELHEYCTNRRLA